MQLAASLTIDLTAVGEAFSKAIAALHKEGKFTPSMLTEKDILQYTTETNAVFTTAIKSGIGKIKVDDATKAALLASASRFSWFKTFTAMTDSSFLLTDSNGDLKTFEQFSKDVQTLDETYNQRYLKTEYNYAQASASAAATWQRDTDDGDGRYLLQYRTAGDERVRESHAALEGTTLPASDPFWSEFYPPNGWNCRCTARRILKTKATESDSATAVDQGKKVTSGKHEDMFRFNPGQQKKVFPDYNSYTIKACKGCDRTKTGNDLCAACKVVESNLKKQ